MSDLLSTPRAHNARAAREAEDHQLFFADSITGTVVSIDEEEAHHASSVLRLSVGDGVAITDGRGTIYQCRLSQVTRDGLRADIVSQITRDPPRPLISIFVGLPERDAFERIIEELPPLGVQKIIPVECAYCQKPWWDRSWEKLAPRFRRKMIVAIKQSKNPFLPDLAEPVAFSDAAAMIKGTLLFADQEGVPLGSLKLGDGACSVFVGPPGGFSPEEITSFTNNGAHRVSIAPYRLRTELAATVACAILRGSCTQG